MCPERDRAMDGIQQTLTVVILTWLVLVALQIVCGLAGRATSSRWAVLLGGGALAMLIGIGPWILWRGLTAIDLQGSAGAVPISLKVGSGVIKKNSSNFYLLLSVPVQNWKRKLKLRSVCRELHPWIFQKHKVY